MKIGIMQPYFFPYLGYWQLINAVDKYVVYDDVNFIKGGWISRNNILIQNQQHMITLQLEDSSPFKLINEIKYTTNDKVIGKLLRTIENAYRKAPYFAEVMPIIAEVFKDTETIADLNYKAIQLVANYLYMNTEIILSSSLEKDNNLKGEDKVIHINKILGSDCYLNTIAGEKLYSKERFEGEGILLHFLSMNSISYPQFNQEFVPNLSIIDVLMFNSKEECNRMLNDYTLV